MDGGRSEGFFGGFLGGEVGLEAEGLLGDGGDGVLEGFEEGLLGGKVGGGGGAGGFDREGFGSSGGEEIREVRVRLFPGFLGDLEVEFSGQGLQEVELIGRIGERVDWDLDVDAAGAFEVDLDEVGAGGGEDPEDFTAIAGAGHFLRHHGVDAGGNTGIAAAGGALAQRLIGLVNEHDAATEGVKEGENFLQIGFGRADPTGTEVLEHDNGDTGLTREAGGEVGFSGADGSAEKVAHGHDLERVLLPEFEVLAEVVLDAGEADDVVEGAGGLDKVDEAAAIAFDEGFLEAREVGLGEGRVVVVTTTEKFLYGRKSGSGKTIGDLREGFGGEVLEGLGGFFLEEL